MLGCQSVETLGDIMCAEEQTLRKFSNEQLLLDLSLGTATGFLRERPDILSCVTVFNLHFVRARP